MEHARFNLDIGSHESLTPERTVCVTEAAIVAAGFEYREVINAYSSPECFSRPVVAYAIFLNDITPDSARQTLLAPFISRLAGTADCHEVELARARFMVRETCHRIVAAFAADVLKRSDLAAPCKNARTVMAAALAIWDVMNAASVEWGKEAPEWGDKAPSFGCVDRDSADDADAVLSVMMAGRMIALCSSRAERSRTKYCTIGTLILDEAIMLGARAHPQRDHAAIRSLVPA